MTPCPTWQDIRDAAGKLLFRFDPARDLIEVGERGRVVVVDLSQYRPPPHEQPASCSRSV